MKNYFKVVLSFALATIWFVGCKKDENKNFFLGGTNPSLSANKTNIVLTPATENDEAIRLSWTNPNYKFGTGVSSHDVQYTLEFDINQNFNSNNRFQTTISRDLGKTYTVFELNKVLGNNMLLPLEQDVTIYARVLSSLRFEGAVNGELASNIISFRTRPYAPPPAVDLPSTGRLVLVGGATPGGWDNNANNPQVFTQISPTLYEITIQLNGGSAFLMLPVAGDWGDKYGWDGPNEANNVNGDKMARGGGDIKPPPTPGLYKITADFQIGRFTVTPQ